MGLFDPLQGIAVSFAKQYYENCTHLVLQRFIKTMQTKLNGASIQKAEFSKLISGIPKYDLKTTPKNNDYIQEWNCSGD